MTVSTTRTGVVHLAERAPQLAGAEMVAALIPPPQFADATFDTYRADPAYPSQQDAKDLLQAFSGAAAPVKGRLFRRAFGWRVLRTRQRRRHRHERQGQRQHPDY